jgi:hypothetical protein
MGAGEAVFLVESEAELRESADMQVQELRRAEELARENRELMLRTWNEHLG